MKRLDLVQLTIIIAGIISAFFCLALFPRFLIYFFSWFSNGLTGGFFMQAFIENILLLTVYLLFSLFCIKNSKHLAEWIGNKANLHAEINIALDKTSFLYALFIGLGIYGLVKELPVLLIDGFNYIRDRNNSLRLFEESGNPVNEIITAVIKTALFLVMVIYARVFAEFFSAKINNPDPVDEINNTTD